MAQYIEDALPIVKYHGLNTAKPVTMESTLAVTGAITASGGINTTGASGVTGDFTVTSGNLVIATAGKGISFTGTGTQGGVLTNLYNTAASTLSGTQRDIQILIGTVPYYFTVYPTKA